MRLLNNIISTDMGSTHLVVSSLQNTPHVQQKKDETIMSKVLDKLVKTDPRIKSYNKDIDGYWVDLEDGYNWAGCSLIHENTVKDIIATLPYIDVGQPY